MTTKKIEDLKRTIFESHLIDLKFRMDEVLSICDSEIERLMLLQFYNYFQNYGKVKRDYLSHFSKIDFIEDEIMDVDPETKITIAEKIRLEEKIRKYNYRYEYAGYYKYIGFRVKANISWTSMEEIETNPNMYIDDSIFQEFEIYPQFETKIDGINYRIDIAIILNRRQKNKIIDTRRIALECDGYDYHSSPEQKKSDDIRTRKLKTNGWKEVFRYSGSEIYRINDIGEVHYNFEEILKMLMI